MLAFHNHRQRWCLVCVVLPWQLSLLRIHRSGNVTTSVAGLMLEQQPPPKHLFVCNIYTEW